MYPHHTKWPEWANWAATDLEGHKIWFQFEPAMSDAVGSWMPVGKAESIKGIDNRICLKWQHTLRSKQQQKEIDMKDNSMDKYETESARIRAEYDADLRAITAKRNEAESKLKHELKRDAVVFRAVEAAVPNKEDWKRLCSTQLELVNKLYDAGLLIDPKPHSFTELA